MAHNIYHDLPTGLKNERFTELLNTPGVRIETIVSQGHTTPKDEWYDQESDEWVLVLKGAAQITLQGCNTCIDLKPGDHLHIPAHIKHRVSWSSDTEPTLWLAVHFK